MLLVLGLDYYLEFSITLVADLWTNADYHVIDTSVYDDGFATVTNQVATVNGPALFIRLRIRIE